MRRGAWLAVALALSAAPGRSAQSGEPPEKTVVQLVAELKAPDVAVRRDAADSLADLGKDAQSALPALTAAVSDARSGIRREAAAAIGRIGIAVAASAPPPAAAAPDSAAPRAAKRTESAVLWALRWLKNHQAPDGRWDPAGFDAQCKLNRCIGPGEAAHTPGVTALSLLAFLGCGVTPQNGADKETVRTGLSYLRGIQDADGCFGPRTDRRFLFDHACAALAVTEAYGMTGITSLKEPAQRAVGFILKAKNPYLGWRYDVPAKGENDTAVTGWMVMALKSASMSDLEIDKTALAEGLAWIERATDPATGRTGYRERGGACERTKEAAAKFPAARVESTTAVGVISRIFAQEKPREDPMIAKGVELMAKKPPRWDVADGSIDYYYWYFATLAMFQAGGARWKAWNDATSTLLADHQRMESERDERGSWDPVDVWSPQGGRVYATALNCLSMVIYYREASAAKTEVERAKLPVMPEAVVAAVAALTEARKSDDPALRDAASDALDRLHAAYATVAPPPAKK